MSNGEGTLIITMIIAVYSRLRIALKHSVRLLYLAHVWWLISLTAAVIAVPSAALCDIRQFVPKIIDYNGELDISMLRQTNSNTTGGTKLSTTDTAIVEQLKLQTTGYLYSPAFITFVAGGSVGLLQDKFQTNDSSSAWSNSSANEYSLSVHVLPEKPYTLDLLTSRTEPFAGTNTFSNVHPVIYVNSANFYYRGSPIGFSAGYTNTKTISDTTTNSGIYSAQASHSIQHSYTSIGFTHSDTTSDIGLDYAQTYYFLSHQLQFDRLPFVERLLLRSDLKYDYYKQTDPFQINKGNDNAWIEYLHLQLPWRFESDLTYSRTHSASKSSPSADSSNSAQFSQANTNTSINEVFSHRLGDSLFTTYTYNDTTNKSTGGSSESQSNSMNVLYTKKIPWGIFTAGVNGTIMDTKETGSIITLNEVHTAKANGLDSFTLQAGLIDPATIVVDLIAPVTGQRIPLVNNVNYLIDQIGNTFRITILVLPTVPGFTPSPDPNFVYTFNVTYRTEQGTFALKTTTTGYNVGLVLFNNLLNPYYSHQHSTQTLESGFFPGELLSYTVDTEGLVVQKAPFRLWTEYQTYDSRINPSRSWRSRLDFRTNIARSLSVGAGVFYNRSYFLQSQASVGLTSPYTETVRGATVSVQKMFPWNMSASGAGYFAQTTGRTDSNSYSLNGLLAWRLGRMSVDLQTTYQRVDSVANNIRQSTAQTIYLLKLRRQLF